ncbi:MAG: class IV adenylate cyclase [Candidatus Altiarchaeota archaeon]|nr:class IV adenylate cyclase [Candidatus Altiarchaeota archaeon]
MFEVEVKAPSTGPIEAKVRETGKFQKEEVQIDTYFQHPARDFRASDEALRVRSVGGNYFLTYKGPKHAGDVKKRMEIEFPVSHKAFDLLKELGFTESLVVKKNRRYYTVEGFEVVLDDVERLGKFIEIESKNKIDDSKVMAIAGKLGVKKESCTTKSYAELLEEKK